MSRPFAMWIDDAYATRVRGPQILLTGKPLGRAPEIRDALLIHAPFSLPVRVRCKTVLGHPRGAADLDFTFGIADQSPWSPRQYVGAVIVEEGVMVRAYTARLRERVTPYRGPARFELGDDRAWGLISIRRNLLNVVVVGGGLARDDDFWPLLAKIEPEGRADLLPPDIERVSAPFALDAGYWQFPTIDRYARGEGETALVVAPAGPVSVDSAPVFVDGEWRESRLYQQPNGPTQISVESGPGMDTATVTAKFAA